ncbi:MAG: cob(I)yrinic acid a,c-diamide adenosyltransferase [Bacteroidia bacterium]
MKIYTRKGDKGTTGLLGGTRISKASLRIEAYGSVDELNSLLGVVLHYCQSRKDRVREIQGALFTLGAHLAADPEKNKIPLPPLPETLVSELEKDIDAMEAALPPLKNFILPGSCKAEAYIQLARVTCRRTERRVVALNEVSPLSETILRLLNRLSDWLFVWGRYEAHLSGAEDIPWSPSREKSSEKEQTTGAES